MNLIPDGPRELDRQGDAAAAARPERWSAAAGGNHGGGPRSVIPLGLGETPAVPRGKARHVVLVLFCILLPAASVLIELGTRMCADLIFDPLPTPWHVAMALLLPAANAAVFWMTGRDRVTGRRWLGWLNGAAIGVGACYTLLFLPLLPIAVFAILALGIGLLPMGPVFGLVGAIACRARLNHWSQFADRVARPAERPRRVPGLWGGMAAAVVVLVAPHVPVVLTHHGLRMAASNSAAERREGIEFLRRWGSEDAMLRACYRPRSEWRGPWAFAPGGQAVPAWQAQEVFYRVTGTPFEDRPVPSGASRRNDRGWSEAEEQLRGGQTVGSTIDGLSLAGSRMDGTVDPAAATSYTEWTLTFQNRTAAQQEARARVLLPPGGVVSRLTLWIDGEEREAAYGKKAQVRAAYETVVKVQRRDPVLVTSAGPDRVLVQCFPVPPNGTMKTKIGITAPLRLPAADRGALQLPHFLDRNFAIGEGVVHSLWLDGPTPMAAPAAPALTSSGGAKPGVHSLHGDVGEKQLAGRLTVDVPRPAEVTAVWADDPFDKSVGAILQTVESSAEPPPARVVMAVDASASMADALPSVANALAALPPGTRAAAVVAAGEVVELTGTNGAGDAAGVAEQLKRVAARGGQDAVPARARAWDLAAAEPGSIVVWVHGPQPVLLDPPDRLAQRLQQRPNGPRLLELQAVPGANRVLEAVSEATTVESVPAVGSVESSLRDLFSGWSSGAPKVNLVRRQAAEPPAGEGIRRAGLDVARLWAYDEVLKLAHSPSPGATDRAAAVAVAHRLVTPVSGAVVLETQSQYDAAGLKPVSAVPLPPGAWMVLVTLPLAVIAWRRWSRANSRPA